MEREEKKKKVNATKRFDEIRLYLNPRYLLGLILILASFSSAYLISKSSDRMITVWGANVDLAPGEMIEADDLKVIRVRLPDNAAQYLDSKTDLIGTTVLRAIGSSELIPSFALTNEIDLSLARVPISIAREWAPIELRNGSLVDIYGIPNRANQFSQDSNPSSRLLISNIAIDSVDASSRELGGRIGMTVLVPQARVEAIVSAISKYEFLLVSKPKNRF
ncbi:MAG: SAF domain-containing protein [Actinomycetota bacterium]